jgi:hypothetical protein
MTSNLFPRAKMKTGHPKGSSGASIWPYEPSKRAPRSPRDVKQNLRGCTNGAKMPTRRPSAAPNGAQEVQVETEGGPKRSQMIPEAPRGKHTELKSEISKLIITHVFFNTKMHH